MEAADGTTEVVGAADDGLHRVTIVPPAPYRAVGPIELVAPVDTVVTHDVRVSVAPLLTITVVDGGGAPIVDARVELMTVPEGTPIGELGRGSDPRKTNIFAYRPRAWTWASAATDDDGRARVPIPAIRGRDLRAVVTAPDGRERVLRVDDESLERTVVFAESAAVRLIVTGDWPPFARLRLLCRSNEQVAPVPRGPGRFP